MAGGLLLAAAGAIHLRLYVQGYRYLPTVGRLFVVQAVTAFVLAVAVVAARRAVVLAAGAGLLAATAGGYLFSVRIGLFGFRDTLQAPWGRTSLAVEVAGSLALATAAALVCLQSGHHGARWAARSATDRSGESRGRAAGPVGPRRPSG